ncbi:MAG: hypothetical protein V8R23_03270 [Alphaproteobacteria bacterium]
MQKLRKLRSPCLKRAVIGLGLVAAFGAGYRFNEAKWQQLTRRQIKENPQNLTQKPFRMDEYTPEGVKQPIWRRLTFCRLKVPTRQNLQLIVWTA